MHLTVYVKIFSRNESIVDSSRLRTTIYNWNKTCPLNSHKKYLIFKNSLFFPRTLLEAPTIPLSTDLNLLTPFDYLKTKKNSGAKTAQK